MAHLRRGLIPLAALRSPPISRSTPWRLPVAGMAFSLVSMSRVAEVEALVAQFSAEELAELERVVRRARLGKAPGKRHRALDLPPLDLGQMLRPLGTREEWYDEMREERV